MYTSNDVPSFMSTNIDAVAQPASSRDARRFWVVHAWLPLFGLASTLALCAYSDIDTRIADRFFFDVNQMQWLSANSWWGNEAMVDGGRNLLRLIGAIAIALWALTFFRADWHAQRRVLGFFITCLLVSTLLIGGLKTLTNVDCPWDLQRYGGTRPWVALFAERPDHLPPARCFPGAHSGSGFSLMCLYFVFLNRSRKRALQGLTAGLLIGALFSLAQQARGAHFLTHDLCSAFIVWFVCLGLYARFGRLTGPAANV